MFWHMGWRREECTPRAHPPTHTTHTTATATTRPLMSSASGGADAPSLHGYWLAKAEEAKEQEAKEAKAAKRDVKKRRRQAEKPARDAAAARAAKDAAVVLRAEQAAVKRATRVQNQRATQAQQAAARERQTGKDTMASTAKAAARTAKNKAPCKRPVPRRRSHDQHTTQAGQRDALARNVAKEEAKRKLAEKPENAAAARKKAKRLSQKSRRGAKQGVRSQSEEVKLSTKVAREEERSAVPTVADRLLANTLVVDNGHGLVDQAPCGQRPCARPHVADQ